jgi:predicted MFS family arabinose efflux permease
MTTTSVQAEPAAAQPVPLRRIGMLVGARFPGFLGDSLSSFAIPVVIYASTHSTSLSGLAFTVAWLPRVFCLPMVGVLVDRFDLRRQLAVSDLSRTAISLLALAAHGSTTLLIVCACLYMLFDSHATIATESVFANRVARDQISKAQGSLQTESQLASTTGPLVGGFLIAALGATWAFAITAVLFAMGAVATSVAVPAGGRVVRDSAAVKSPFSDLGAGARLLWSVRPLRLLLTCSVLVSVIGGALIANMPPLMLGEFKLSESDYGFIQAVAACVSIGSAALVTLLARRDRPALLLTVSVPLYISAVAVMLFSGGWVCFAAGYCLWNAATTAFSVWLRRRRIALIPPAEVGRTLGIFTAVMLASVPIGGLTLTVFGPLYTALSIVRGVIIVTLLLLSLLALAYAGRRYTKGKDE